MLIPLNDLLKQSEDGNIFSYLKAEGMRQSIAVGAVGHLQCIQLGRHKDVQTRYACAFVHTHTCSYAFSQLMSTIHMYNLHPVDIRHVIILKNLQELSVPQQSQLVKGQRNACNNYSWGLMWQLAYLDVQLRLVHHAGSYAL